MANITSLCTKYSQVWMIPSAPGLKLTSDPDTTTKINHAPCCPTCISSTDSPVNPPQDRDKSTSSDQISPCTQDLTAGLTQGLPRPPQLSLAGGGFGTAGAHYGPVSSTQLLNSLHLWQEEGFIPSQRPPSDLFGGKNLPSPSAAGGGLTPCVVKSTMSTAASPEQGHICKGWMSKSLSHCM